MDISIRKVQTEESKEVARLGRAVFHSMEGLFITKSLNAVVAVHEEKIVGAAILKKYSYKNGYFGYVDYAFVDSKYHGRGIGKTLYAAAVEELKAQGCNLVSALVRADNPGSFRLFEKMNINRCTLGSVIHMVGVKGLFKLMLLTTFGWGPSMDCYLSEAKTRKDGGMQILLYIVINLALLFAGVFRYKESILMAVAAGATLMVSVLLFESVIHLIKKNTYHFRLSTGGFLLTPLIIALGGYFPLIGKWYPTHFENNSTQRKEMCISAISGWIACLAIYIASKLISLDTVYIDFLNFFSCAAIIFNMLPTYPFCEYAGRRIYQFNKIAYLIMWFLSAGVLLCIK